MSTRSTWVSIQTPTGTLYLSDVNNPRSAFSFVAKHKCVPLPDVLQDLRTEFQVAQSLLALSVVCTSETRAE